MSRESETASAVEMWEKVRGSHHAMMEAGDEMARLLRESQPEPAEAPSGTVQGPTRAGKAPTGLHVDSAAPAVGEDEALLAGLDLLAHYQCAPGVTCGIAANARDRLRAALADVEQMKKDLEEARLRSASLFFQRDEARAALAAAEADAEKLRADFPPAPPLPTAGCDCLTCKTMLRQQARAGRNDG